MSLAARASASHKRCTRALFPDEADDMLLSYKQVSAGFMGKELREC